MPHPLQAQDGLHTVQRLIRPDPALPAPPRLFMQTDGDGFVLEPGGFLGTNGYSNYFALGDWQDRCGLDDLTVVLRGSGRVEVAVVLSQPAGAVRLWAGTVDLDADAGWRHRIDGIGPATRRGLLHVEIRALTAVRIDAIDWRTARAPQRQPDLVASITTFGRPEAVQRSVARFRDYLAASPLRGHVRLQVVDNGHDSARPSGVGAGRGVTVIANRNLGGAGGFARGLIEARAAGASHVLFMDDDAAIHMDSIERTWTFLAWATNPDTAVAGAMIDAGKPGILWENGATFDGGCHPIDNGADLRDPDEAAEAIRGGFGANPPHLYGGWWFFAFPVRPVRHLPYPFFVRGDDVSFSLVHDFDIARPPGVVSFQDGFTGKESPLVWYLDLRSHLAHHLSLPNLDSGARTLLRLPVWFFARNLIRLHYETLAAINLAVEDVIDGPMRMAEDADMARRRPQLAALRHAEAWKPSTDPLPQDRIALNPDNPAARWLMKLTANGHLLPFFGRFGNRITLDAADRGAVRRMWGAARITVLSGDGQHYTVAHSKAAAWRQGRRMARNLWRLYRRRADLVAQWRAAYDPLTSQAYWDRALDREGMQPEDMRRSTRIAD
ncbi:putative glycosyltransferase [Oceaniovalibus guishaninsula JLT2003]|uniref:Putative glycosyltransferase n=1 Tax=Oceaniovalibus guishaninsula JLT2003 TaxID=1231392 RepID=K2GPB7_9RHOB|nr:glycosyltransferase [Oceaniovalibus guishaninsula]EKE44521.1 putative glycosyltransferase [Oceaniovalibus guishaninsula JLT2003]